MIDTRPVKKEMLTAPVDIHLGEGALDFQTARYAADAKASEILGDPMLLAWFDGETGKHFPAICCGEGETPSWVIYAETRGARLSVDINEEKYVFIYGDSGIQE